MKPEEKWEKAKKEHNEKIEIVEEITIDEEVEQKKITEEEKQKIKKQLLYLIWAIIIIILIVIAFLIFDIRDNDEEVKDNQQPQINEQNKLELLDDGEVDINNETIKYIDNIYKLEVENPLYEENILKLFSSEDISIKKLDFQTKMLLVTSTDAFKNYMLLETNLKDYQNKEVFITKEKLDELSKKILGEDKTLEHNNFEYYYKIDNKIIYFDVVLQNDKYVFKQTQKQPSKIQIYKNLNYAIKISNELILRYEIYFINENGVFSDCNFTKKISNSINEINSIAGKGTFYDYNYSINYMKENVYLLDNISLSFIEHEVYNEK